MELNTENRALTEVELDAVTGGALFSGLVSLFRKMRDAQRDAAQDFARGDIASGLEALGRI